MECQIFGAAGSETCDLGLTLQAMGFSHVVPFPYKGLGAFENDKAVLG